MLEDRRREFKRARAQWVAVKQRAEEDLEKVKAGARMTYMADAAQFPKIVAGCKAIDTILDNLDDELRDTLDRYASTPVRAQDKLATLAATAIEVLDRYHRYVAGNAGDARDRREGVRGRHGARAGDEGARRPAQGAGMNQRIGPGASR